MSGFFKNKFFIVLAVLCSLLLVLTIVNYATGEAIKPLRNAVNFVITPFQKLGTSFAEGIGGIKAYFTDFHAVTEENRRLSEENAQLRDRLVKAEATEKENEWLRTFLELRQEHADYEIVDARIVGREADNRYTIFSVDRGTETGIRLHDTAVTAEGVVGTVIEAGYGWAKIAAITETQSSIGAIILRTGDIGVLHGDFSLKKDGLCRLSYLDREAHLNIGDSVHTSGLGSLYPDGLLLGTVVDILPEDHGVSQYAVVRPAVDLTSLRAVMIVTCFERGEAEAGDADQ